MRPPSRPIAGVYLAQRTRFGVKFGLDTISALVAEMGHPELAFPTLLVAGTNGKGSVVAYADSVLRASGLRTGRYTSPHLVRVNERITVNGREITEHDLEVAVRAVRDAAARLVRRGAIDNHPTYFEALTAAAFAHFRRRRVDVAVLEAGLGGRLDATNVADPLASAIVTVAFDHEVYLGRTLASIAREKAGVMRRGRATVVGVLPAAARRAVAARARAVGAHLVEAWRGARVTAWPSRATLREGAVRVRTPTRLYPKMTPLPGAHQRGNLVVAVRLLEEARAAGLPVDLDAVAAAIGRTRWPGRLEWVDGRPPLLLDGAHNPAGARALAAYLEDRRPFVLLFGALDDKDVAGIARAIVPLATALVLTRPRYSRALEPAALAARMGRPATGARLEPSVFRALSVARRLARAQGGSTPVVVAGSLFLVGDVKRILERARV